MFDSATGCCFCAIVHDPRGAFFADPNPLLLPSITLSNTRHMPRARLTRSKNYNPCAQTVRLPLIFISSPGLLAELAEVIARPKYDAILVRSNTSRERSLAEVRELTEVIAPPPLAEPVCRDPDDDAVLALGVAANVDFIVSGNGQSGSNLYAQGNAPPRCDVATDKGCSPSIPLYASDILAVAKTCSNWSFAEHIRDNAVSIGWLPNDNRIASLRRQLPFDAGEPPDKNTAFKPRTVRMTLFSGNGMSACEAYLQRLTQTIFHEPPYCGRPEKDQVPGFDRLNRVLAPADKFRNLYGHMVLFSATDHSEDDQDLTRMFDAAHPGTTGEGGAWEYDPAPDIENNGAATPLIGWGAMPAFPVCGDRNRQTGPDVAPKGSRGSQLIFVLHHGGSGVDDIRTRELFEHPISENAGATITRRIGSSMSVFRYRSRYYFDTFFDGNGWPDFLDQRASDPNLDEHLAVFTRKEGKTAQICEYVYDESQSTSRFQRRK